MQGREYGYIKGNTAVAPVRKPKISKNNKKKNSILRKKSKERAIIANKKSDRKYMFLVVATVFIIGCVTIAGDTNIYNMQRQVTQLDSTIKTMKEENEALKVKLLKYSSLSNIEDNASTKLGMHMPSTNDVVKIDFSENYFSGVSQENHSVKNSGKGLFSKIADIFK
ncbi:cell division protein FtsL [Clostridium sp. SM-530-WT-3G]|uniref:cell division protein FtsL n=1 Tax=Clostridium sp. SM-530-WT-3G TaxID=2725303 RepID=UPI00145CD5D8|nr:cell division protein FtsL [Clostridium sp. SM-530-WT-3G]NME82032.1 cell division protein FtsL [Clostridium sp. SM-530-WT-3G]